jgi:hypothetical protein
LFPYTTRRSHSLISNGFHFGLIAPANRRNESKGRRADVDEIDRQELYIENGVLNMIAAWLEPLPDKSLPAVQIRTAMIEALNDVCMHGAASWTVMTLFGTENDMAVRGKALFCCERERCL